MAVSVLRFLALAAVVSVVSGYALGEMPSQTIGMGLPITHILPTDAPSLELVKRGLKKKAVTNACSEWTISDGIGSSSKNDCKAPNAKAFCLPLGVSMANISPCKATPHSVTSQKLAFSRARRMDICMKAVVKPVLHTTGLPNVTIMMSKLVCLPSVRHTGMHILRSFHTRRENLILEQ
jgi:hypothetical protein